MLLTRMTRFRMALPSAICGASTSTKRHTARPTWHAGAQEHTMIDPRQKDILTFDCYGTLIDWERGILTALQPVLRAHGVAMDDEQLLEHYATFEAEAERGPYLTYREVLATCLRRFGEQMAFSPTANDIASFSSSVGDWPAFPDSAAALAALKRCFSLAVLTNMDDDLFALSNEKLGRPFATIITAQQLRSYKPAEANFHAA